MPSSNALSQSEQWLLKCSDLISGLNYSPTDRFKVSLSLQHLCIEHFMGIHVLVAEGVCGSAFALFRPQFEAYVRGVWYHRCASDDQVQKFINGNDPPKIGILIKDIENTATVFESGRLSSMKNNMWTNLNDLTHGGSTQVAARLSERGIDQSFLPEHVAGLLTSSATLSALAGLDMARAIENDELASSLWEEFSAIYEPTA